MPSAKSRTRISFGNYHGTALMTSRDSEEANFPSGQGFCGDLGVGVQSIHEAEKTSPFFLTLAVSRLHKYSDDLRVPRSLKEGSTKGEELNSASHERGVKQRSLATSGSIDVLGCTADVSPAQTRLRRVGAARAEATAALSLRRANPGRRAEPIHLCGRGIDMSSGEVAEPGNGVQASGAGCPYRLALGTFRTSK